MPPYPADSIGIMPGYTRENRSSRNMFPPQYARSLEAGQLPHGGAWSVPELEAWQLAPKKVMRGVPVCNPVHMRVT
jgi:hypothetical protein